MLSLISLSLQDSHCLVSLEYCEEEEENSKDPVKIEHCYEMKGDKCDDCLIGYAASYEGTSCLPFQNCNSLEEGNKNCAECYYGFKVNSNANAKELYAMNMMMKVKYVQNALRVIILKIINVKKLQLKTA